MADGEKPSGGARETRLKSRIDRSAGGRRRDNAEIGRGHAEAIVYAIDVEARNRPGNRESSHLGVKMARAAVIFPPATLQRKSESQTDP